MNTTISNPKVSLLLGASLNVLHFESKEWLDTVNFWKDEVKFFDNLLKKKTAKNESEQEYGKTLENLDKIHANLFKYLENDIIAHEKLLSILEKGEKGLSDSVYREKHSHLLARMESFKTEFNQFKKVVFDYVKNL